MGDILVLAEPRGGSPRKVAFEVVTAARRAADSTGGGEEHALVVGAPGTGQASEMLTRYGADVVLAVEHDGLAFGNPAVSAATMVAQLRAHSYRMGLFSASAQGRDLAPRVAGAMGVALAADVTSFEIS